MIRFKIFKRKSNFGWCIQMYDDTIWYEAKTDTFDNCLWLFNMAMEYKIFMGYRV